MRSLRGMLMRVSLSIFLLCLPQELWAKNDFPVPRFVSIRASEVNMRTGPNVRYPVRWVYVKKGEPVEIIAEFEQWRKIRDRQGDNGWVHETMLSGKRFVIINGPVLHMLYKKPTTASPPLVRIEPEARAELLSCEKEWCRIEVSSYKGWIERRFLWGIYPQEDIK